jgi:hypothetical protein
MFFAAASLFISKRENCLIIPGERLEFLLSPSPSQLAPIRPVFSIDPISSSFTASTQQLSEEWLADKDSPSGEFAVLMPNVTGSQ